MNGAELLVRTARENGVSVFFGLPGSTEAALLEAIRADGGLRYVLGLHEGAVVAMADGYARATGRPGMVGLHTSVGTMNGLSQVYNAFRDRSPLVVTAGHKDSALLAGDGFCALPHLPSLLRDFTKWSWQSLSAAAVPVDLARALRIAATPPFGPTFLAVPEDLLREDVRGPDADSAAAMAAASMSGQLPVAGQPDQAAISAALDLLCAAERPVLVVGSSAAGVVGQLRALADDLQLPILLTELTDLEQLPFPSGDERYAGLYGEDKAVLDGCDLVLAVGCSVFFPFSTAARPRLPAGARLIHAHQEAAEIGRDVPADVALLGAPAATLAALVTGLRRRGGLDGDLRRRRAARVGALRRSRADELARELAAAPGTGPLAIEHIAAELSRVLPPDAIIVDEGVRSSRPLLRHLRTSETSLVLHSRGGGLGWGVPAAVGAKIGRPDRPVVAIVGDGSLHFCVQAIWTAVTEQAPIVIVILDNGGYLAVKRAIETFVGLPHDPRWHPGTDLPGIDHLTVARGYGADGVHVSEPAALGAAVKEGLESGRVLVVHAPVVRVPPH
jgi:benzoylformate decarboxylase